MPESHASYNSQHRQNLGTPVKIPERKPKGLTQIAITNLTNSPRNSRNSFTGSSDIGRDLRNLQTFKDLFVSRKRIAIGQVLCEGRWWEEWGGGGGGGGGGGVVRGVRWKERREGSWREGG